MPGMGGQDMAAMAAYRRRSTSSRQSGVEAPGVIHTITRHRHPRHQRRHHARVRREYPPRGRRPHQTTIEQSMLPFQLEGLAEGQALTAKYDPDLPTSAVLQSW